MVDGAVLIAAAFFAGILNAIAGGGTFLTFPALVYAGVPPVAANATSAVAVFPGYLGGAAGFRRELVRFDRRLLCRLAVVSLAGSLIGSLLLLVSSDEVFRAIIPVLLLTATACFAFQERVQRWAGSGRIRIRPYGAPGIVLVSLYGGYFNGGLGIVLLALFALWGMRDLAAMNGLKNAVSFVISIISVITFAAAGIVAWPAALMMMAASVAGGYAGAALARVLRARVVRGIIIAIGLSMSAIFAADLVR